MVDLWEEEAEEGRREERVEDWMKKGTEKAESSAVQAHAPS